MVCVPLPRWKHSAQLPSSVLQLQPNSLQGVIHVWLYESYVITLQVGVINNPNHVIYSRIPLSGRLGVSSISSPKTHSNFHTAKYNTIAYTLFHFHGLCIWEKAQKVRIYRLWPRLVTTWCTSERWWWKVDVSLLGMARVMKQKKSVSTCRIDSGWERHIAVCVFW